MTTAQEFNYASAFFAVVAAVLWFWSARVKTPAEFEVVVEVQTSPDGSGIGGGGSVELTELGYALKRQSRRSGWAAVSAGVSAILMALGFMM